MKTKKLNPITERRIESEGILAKEQGFHESSCRYCGAKAEVWRRGYNQGEYKYKGLDS